MTEPLLCDLSVAGRRGVRFPEADVPTTALPEDLTRADLPMPELSEVDVVRHFTRLSKLNYCIDEGMYPLGSCTMKYNPRSMKRRRACQEWPDCIPCSRPRPCRVRCC